MRRPGAQGWLVVVVALLVAGLLEAWPVLAASAPSATPEQLAALDEILSRPEFQAAQGRSALDRLLDPLRSWVRWLGRELARRLAWLFEPAVEGGETVVLGVVVGGGIIILAGVALVLRRLAGGALAGDAALADPIQAGSPRAADELTRARTLARAGEARRAIHHHYRAILLRLDERDHLPYHGSLTNRELLPRLTAAPALAEPFAALVSFFDRLWYGQTDCSAADYAAFAELADRVWEAAGTVAPAGAPQPTVAAAPSESRAVS